MLHTCAVNFANLLYRHCSLPAGHRAVYIYGSELLFSTSLSITSILLTSLLMNRLISGILFILIFVSLRVFVGGFHAMTYGRCFLLTNGIFLVTLGFSVLLQNCKPLISAQILIFASGIIWALAPVRNNHHPLSEKIYKKNKKIGRTLTIAEGITSISIYLLKMNPAICSISIASIAAVAVMMIIPKLTERRTTHE